MDRTTQYKSLIAFYFNTQAAHAATKTEDQTKEDLELLVRAASSRAYRDLQRTLRGIGSHKDKEELLEGVTQSLITFVDTIDPSWNQNDFDEAHLKWREARCAEFEQKPHQSYEKFRFTHGHAQKWLNMTLKYLAVLNHPKVLSIYPLLHVPIDRYVYIEAKKAGVDIIPKYPPSWSTLNAEQYDKYQMAIRSRISENHEADPTNPLYACPLDWEANAWIERNYGAKQ